jgi:hypothetical protein
MPERSRPPYRAEQIGSFLRTPAVFEARTSYESGKLEQKQLTQTEDEGIKTVVALQKEVGLKTLTDGEYRRIVCYPASRSKMIFLSVPSYSSKAFKRVSKGSKSYTGYL